MNDRIGYGEASLEDRTSVMLTSDSELVITPSVERWKRTLRTAPVWLVAFAAVSVLRLGLLGVVLAAVTVVLAIAVWYVYLRRARVIVTPAEIGKAGLTGRAKMHPRSDVATLVYATVGERFGDTRRFRNLFVLDSAGRSIMRLRSSHWAESDMDRLAAQLGIEPADPGRVVTGSELGAQYPNAVPWFERRPVLTAVLATLVILVFATVIAVIVVASRP